MILNGYIENIKLETNKNKNKNKDMLKYTEALVLFADVPDDLKQTHFTKMKINTKA